MFNTGEPNKPLALGMPSDFNWAEFAKTVMSIAPALSQIAADKTVPVPTPSLPVTVSRKRTATVKTKKGKKPKGGGGVQKLAESLSK